MTGRMGSGIEIEGEGTRVDKGRKIVRGERKG